MRKMYSLIKEQLFLDPQSPGLFESQIMCSFWNEFVFIFRKRGFFLAHKGGLVSVNICRHGYNDLNLEAAP